MPRRTYYCDYYDIRFKDMQANRKQHEQDIQHRQAKHHWYDSFKLEEQQNQKQLLPDTLKDSLNPFVATSSTLCGIKSQLLCEARVRVGYAWVCTKFLFLKKKIGYGSGTDFM